MMKRALSAMLCMTAFLAVAGCSESNRNASPVELIATVEQNIQIIDIRNLPDEDENIGTITLRAIRKRAGTPTLPIDDTFLDVRLRSYRVSYRRTDGGTLVPASFVRSLSGLVELGGTTQVSKFQVFEIDALTRAPFVALLPNNGGRDPETGRTVVGLDVVIDIFGETLSGEPVAARVIFPLTFCAGCTT